ncbi:PEGA domain-containing protein [Pyxidicoccus fallax]|uniref:PEGA domain-containing protein n=1 Tax=Pyxidicoccus fallax TaxID=394095 RepID=A0A848LI21_9BACT|nr:PEGA domain-containing protein [Pyxidicoccus fallax]NMO17098.1 PEGA domain-containing protein [Pyxidicoccus fallax]NPC78837.1 PEGA domain-containing protein [Pyxidicoccus fallax]
MRIPPAPPIVLLALALWVHPAWAQEGGLGLDLSTDTPAQEESPGVGLDLRDNDSTDLKPRFVLLGLDTPERAGAQQSSNWFRALARGAMSSGMVAWGSNIQETRERLAQGYAAATRCSEVACLSEPADALDADLLTSARLSLEDAGWTLRLWTYDRDRRVVVEDVVTGRNPRDAAFLKEAEAKLASRVMALARPRALLKVEVNVPQAVVKVGERILGVGSVEARLSPGTSQLEVSADEYSTFTRTLNLKPGQTESLEVRLEISGPAPEGPGDEAVGGLSKRGAGGPSIFKRPALYTAVAGLAAVAVGVVVGMGAKDVEKRGGDANGDGIYDLTRKERLDAQSQANLATALIVGGGVVTAGSVAWLVVVPTRSEPKTSVQPGGTGGASTALQLVVGGSF